MKIAVVGVGAMGLWFADFAKHELGEVVVADISATKARLAAEKLDVRAARTSAEAVSDADVVIVAVPIAKTPEVVKEVAEHAKEGALLMDVASAKSEVVDAMRGIKRKLELVSLHPLFGPGAKGVKDRDFVAIPVKPGKRYESLKGRLLELGARFTEMHEEEHDRLMAISQCMTHFVLLAYLYALRTMKGIKMAERLRIPMFAKLVDLAKAVLAGNPDLYGELQVFNRYSQLTRSALMEACRELDVAFAAHDVKAARTVFKQALTIWGPAEAQAAYKRLYESFEGGT